MHSSEGGIGVEEAICRRVCTLGFKNRGGKRRGDLLVMNTVKKRYGISHALIETCFIDDTDDMALYRKTKPYVARVIAAGIAEGFGVKYEDTGIQTGTVAQEDNNKMTNAEIQQITKKAAQDVVQATFTSIYNKANPLYTSLGQVPDYWQQEVSEMIQCDAIKGDGTHETSIRYDALQAAVIAFRATVEINRPARKL